jgi:hypothetical protein
MRRKVTWVLVPACQVLYPDKALKKVIVFADKLNREIVLLNVLKRDVLQSGLILKYWPEKLL